MKMAPLREGELIITRDVQARTGGQWQGRCLRGAWTKDMSSQLPYCLCMWVRLLLHLPPWPWERTRNTLSRKLIPSRDHKVGEASEVFLLGLQGSRRLCVVEQKALWQERQQAP